MKFKSGLTYRNFVDYFSNKLKKKEKHAFEKKMMQDDFDSEAFDGLSKISSLEFEQDFAELKNQIHARTHERKRRIPIWFPYAASIAILIGLGAVLMYLNQYSVQDELIGAQLEEIAKRVESPILEPQISTQDSESIDLMEMIDEDLEMEISDADEIIEEELMIVSVEQEVEDEIIPMVKRKEIELIAPLDQITVADGNSKMEAEISAESMQRALEGQVAGVEVKKARRQKSAKKSIANNPSQIARIISGKVVDEDEMPLPGVSIVVKGTAIGAVTNMDGQFMIHTTETNQNYELTASFIGYEQKEVNAQADSILLVILEPDNSSLNELVVVGYGSSTSKAERGNTSWEKAKPNQFASISKFEEHLIQELNNANLEHLIGTFKVKFSFYVETSGKLSNIKFKGNPDAVLLDEIERLLLKSGEWHPAESGGKAVSSKIKIVLKINFK